MVRARVQFWPVATVERFRPGCSAIAEADQGIKRVNAWKPGWWAADLVAILHKQPCAARAPVTGLIDAGDHGDRHRPRGPIGDE